MYTYVIVEETYKNQDCGEYSGYGIKAYYNEIFIQYIADITHDKTSLESLVSLYNEHQLYAAHLLDAVEDFIIGTFY